VASQFPLLHKGGLRGIFLADAEDNFTKTSGHFGTPIRHFKQARLDLDLTIIFRYS